MNSRGSSKVTTRSAAHGDSPTPARSSNSALREGITTLLSVFSRSISSTSGGTRPFSENLGKAAFASISAAAAATIVAEPAWVPKAATWLAPKVDSAVSGVYRGARRVGDVLENVMPTVAMVGCCAAGCAAVASVGYYSWKVAAHDEQDVVACGRRARYTTGQVAVETNRPAAVPAARSRATRMLCAIPDSIARSVAVRSRIESEHVPISRLVYCPVVESSLEVHHRINADINSRLLAELKSHFLHYELQVNMDAPEESRLVIRDEGLVQNLGVDLPLAI